MKQPIWTPISEPKTRKKKGKPSRLPPEVVRRLHEAEPGEPSFTCEDCKITYKLKAMREVKDHVWGPTRLICKWCWAIRCGSDLEYEKMLRKINRRK